MISTPGVGSGLDIRSIITQLMAIERTPLVKLGTEQVELQAQVSAVGKLKSDVSLFRSAMSDLSDAAKFKYFKASSSDDKVVTASADSTAAKGSYTIAVSRIAENHRMAADTVFADIDTTHIGTAGDTMSITVGSTSFVVDIGDKTLGQIRDAINLATGNAGVTASTLQDDTGYHLTLSADDTGSDHSVGVTYSAVDPFTLGTLNTDRDGSGSFSSADLDAVVTIEGAFSITRSSNTVSDVIQGVTLSLAGAGTSILTVTRDDGKIAGSVQQFIGVYNQVVKTIGELRGNVLSSERGALNSLEAQFRSILNSKAGTSSAFSFATELGITTGLDGRLSLNTTMFNSALKADAAGVADMFVNPNTGLATRFEDLAASFINAGGVLDNREQSLKSQIDEIAKARTNMEYRLTLKEAALTKQYSALDALIASLNTTSSYLTTQLAQFEANSK